MSILGANHPPRADSTLGTKGTPNDLLERGSRALPNLSSLHISTPPPCEPKRVNGVNGLVLYYSDCEQDRLYYNNCVRTLRIMQNVVSKQYGINYPGTRLDTRVVFGGDAHDIQGGALDAYPLKQVTLSEMLASWMRNRRGLAVVGNRDVNKLRLLWELPTPVPLPEDAIGEDMEDETVEPRRLDELSRPTLVETTAWVDYNIWISEHMNPLRESQKNVTASQFNLWVYLKLVKLIQKTMGASYQQSGATTCGPLCSGFMEYFLEVCRTFNNSTHIDTLRDVFRSGLGEYTTQERREWVDRNAQNRPLVEAATEVVTAVHYWIGGPSRTTGLTRPPRVDVSMRAFLEQASLVECAELDNYRVLVAHAGMKGYGGSVMFKYPSGVQIDEFGRSPNVEWTYLSLSNHPQAAEDDALVDKWCNALNRQFHAMVNHIYKVYDTDNEAKFEFTHEAPFEGNIVNLDTITTLRLVTLLGGPGNQGPASTAMVGYLNVPTYDTVNLPPYYSAFVNAYNKRPTTWLLGHNPFPTCLYAERAETVEDGPQSNASQVVHNAMRVDTQYKRPSFAVAAVFNADIADAVIKQLSWEPPAGSVDDIEAIKVFPNWINEGDWHVTCGPQVYLPLTAEGLIQYKRARALVCINGYKTRILFENEGALTDAKRDTHQSDRTLQSVTVSLGALCIPVEQGQFNPNTLQAGFELKTNDQLGGYADAAQNFFDDELGLRNWAQWAQQTEMSPSGPFGRSHVVKNFDAVGDVEPEKARMKMDAVLLTYVADSRDPLLGLVLGKLEYPSETV